MKSLIMVSSATLLALSSLAPAAEEAGTSPHEWSANVAITTEYLYRGLTQSNEDPAIQGGFDYSNSQYGFYAGAWASSIEFNAGTADTASAEVDFYAGFAGQFANGVTWDFGGLYYYYPDTDEDVGADYNFWEVYGNLGYTFEASFEPTLEAGFAWSPDYFGEDDDSIYVHGAFSIALPHDFGAYVRTGYIDVEGDKLTPGGYDYFHYAVGVTWEFGILTFDGSWNDADDDCGPSDLCEAFVLSVSSSW